MDPISTTIALSGGEPAVLYTSVVPGASLPLLFPGSPEPAINDYDPSSPDDYAPVPPVGTPVIGLPEAKIEHVQGAVGAYTMQATSLPVGLEALASKLVWRGQEWTILKWRERYWLGKVNGVTLYLQI